MRRRLILIVGVALIAYAAFGLSVSRTLHADDITAIQRLAVGAACTEIAGYEAELACLTAIQTAVQSLGTTECATRRDTIEPLAFIERGHGCCFDRSRFIEKAARYYGFETRHIFLIERQSDGPLALALAFLPLGQSSHAATEVLTAQGWLGVDLNEPFVLTDPAGAPLTYAAALGGAESAMPMQPAAFFAREFHVLIGLYSRHGMFFGPKLPGPEFSWVEVRHNFGSAG